MGIREFEQGTGEQNSNEDVTIAVESQFKQLQSSLPPPKKKKYIYIYIKKKKKTGASTGFEPRGLFVVPAEL